MFYNTISIPVIIYSVSLYVETGGGICGGLSGGLSCMLSSMVSCGTGCWDRGGRNTSQRALTVQCGSAFENRRSLFICDTSGLYTRVNEVLHQEGFLSPEPGAEEPPVVRGNPNLHGPVYLK